MLARQPEYNWLDAGELRGDIDDVDRGGRIESRAGKALEIDATG